MLKKGLFIVIMALLSIPFLLTRDAKSYTEEMTPCTVKVAGEKLDARCGSIQVPENRADANSRTLTLPITQILATAQASAEPIFYLAGGPGMSNLGFKPPLALLENHDVVLVGYRGVDGPISLHCSEMETAVKGIDNQLFSPAAAAGVRDAAAACGQRLQSEGVDLDGYTIPEVVMDMEAARNKLGYGRIHLLSESYGTRVAQIYAQMAPDSLHRVVMIGVNTPGDFVWEPELIDSQLGQYGALCAADAYCQTQTEDLVELMRSVNHNMPSQWLGVTISPDKVKAMSFVLLFHPNTAVYIFDAYVAASNGDASGLALLSLAYDMAMPKLTVWGEFLAKGFSADFDPNRDYTELANPDSVMGSPLAQLIWAGADQWPMDTIPEAYQQVQPSSVETLLVSGDIDFSTPIENGTEKLLPSLEKGDQVVLKNMGHVNDVWHAQPAATERLLTHYYATGEVDDSLYVEQEIEFATGLISLPNVAKGLLGVGLILLIVFIGIVVLVVRKRRHRGV